MLATIHNREDLSPQTHTISVLSLCFCLMTSVNTNH